LRFERLSPPRGLAKVPIGRDLLTLDSRASGLDALLCAVFDLLAVAGNRLGLEATVEVGLRRGEVGLGRAALHRRPVCITCVGNHCHKCSVGYIHGECMWLLMGYSYGRQSICGIVKIHDGSNIIMYLSVSFYLLVLLVFLRLFALARLFFERAALRLFLDLEARRNVLFRRPPR